MLFILIKTKAFYSLEYLDFNCRRTLEDLILFRQKFNFIQKSKSFILFYNILLLFRYYLNNQSKIIKLF